MGCTLTAPVLASHLPDVRLVSASHGLQEAINDLAGGGSVIIDDHWRGNTVQLLAVQLPSNVLIRDRRGARLDIYGRDPASGLPTRLWHVDSSLGTTVSRNSDQVIHCTEFAGSDAGAQIQACINALPASGGVADARGLQGAQTANQTINLGSKAVELLLGAIRLTSSANPAIAVSGPSWIRGISPSASVLITTAPGATCVYWTGSGGGMQGLQCNGQAGTGHGLLLDAAATSVQFNTFENLILTGPVNSNDGVRIVAVPTTVASFNHFQNLEVLNFSNSVHLTSTGATGGPTDNLFIGGQYRKYVNGGNGLLIDGGAVGNGFFGGNFTGSAAGVNIISGGDNYLFGLLTDFNTTDFQVGSGSSDNHFLGVAGKLVDSGVRTTFLSSDNNNGPGGTAASFLGSALSRLTLLSLTGWPHSLVSVATQSRTVYLPDATGTVALSTQLPINAGTLTLAGGNFAAGQCQSATQTAPGALTSMAAVASPSSDPGAFFLWSAWVTAPGVVAVRLCAVATSSAPSTNFNVRVVP